MISAKMLEDLADRYDADWLSDGNIKTISYPAREPYNSRKKVSPMMMKMRERIKMNKETFDRTFTKANELKTNITNNIERNTTVGKIRKNYNAVTNKIKDCLAEIGLINGKTQPIANKIRARHLELEPLCCMSSCLVRGGCTTVVVFEIIYVILTLAACALKFYDGGRWRFWEEFEPNFNAIVTHRFFVYILIIFDILTALMVLVLLRGLIRFDKLLIKRHWQFDFVALGFNVFAFVFYLLGVSSQGPETWTIDNVLLIVCFGGQILLQLWAVSVVKSCLDFFTLLNVFINLADA
uniref:Uncharacterized protein n=1 Tax=Panagrolaimus sp. JU765 TaxID=591449 RepID=A0AC34PUM5_9BILA